MSNRLRNLRAKKAQAVKDARAIYGAASAAGRDMTAEETRQFDTHTADIERLNADIEREEKLIEAERSMGVVLPDGAISGGHDRRVDDPRHGFRNLGEFAQAVRRAGMTENAVMDERLTIGAAAPSTYGSEAVGTDSGFLVPPDFSTEIFNLSLTDDALLPMTDNIDVSGNSMVFPKDETTPWGTDGVRAYWQAEASAGTPTKPKLGTATLRLHKLLALVPLTDELVSDTNALNGYLPNLMGRSIRWKTNEAVLFGNGNGQPLGAFTGNAGVVQAKDSGQATLTLSLTNITNMIARLLPGSYPRAVWLITPDALPSLFGMTLGNYPIYLPINAGAQGSPYGTLMGRPIMVSQHSAAFSSQGDISLVDLSYYRTITKAGGVQMASSMHLYFDADATAFRATFRVDGQPKIAAAVSQAKGSKTLSPFIQLAAR